MAITFDAAGGNKVTSNTTNTFSHTVASGQSNQILLVAVDAGASISSVKYNGTNLTQLGSKTVSGSEVLSLWYLLAPSTGANNVVITCSSSTFIIGASTSYYGVAQTSTFGTLASNSGSGSSSTNTVTTTSSSQLVIDCLNNTAASTNTATASQTKREQPASSGVASGDIAATGSNMTLTWSFTSSSWAQISVAMNAATVNPALSTSPTSMTFTAGVGGANPASQTDTLSETNGVGTAWTSSISYTTGSGWLAISPTSGTLAANGTQSITVSCTTGALAVGTYTATVTFTATTGGATATINVTFTVQNPALSTSPTSMTFSATVGGANPTSQTDTLSETHGSATAWTSSISYTSGTGWLAISPTSGSLAANGTASITVSCTTGALAAGTYTATVTFSATTGGATATISVSFTVGAPALATSPTTMTFSAIVNGSNPASQTDTLSETNGVGTAWTSAITYTSGSGWLSISPTSGTLAANGSATITVSCVTTGLVSGTYTGTVTFTATSGGATATISVSFTILSSTPVSYPNTIIDDGAIAYYRFDESSGSALDSSGNNYTASCTSITYNQGGAIIGSSDTAYGFNGTSSKVVCSSGPSAVGWNKITVEAWVKLSSNSFAHKATIWASGTTANGANSGDGFDFWIGNNGSGGGFAVGVSGSRWGQAAFSQTFTAGTWYHVAGSWDGSTITVYVNGVANGTTGMVSGNIDSANGNPVAIGQDPQANGSYFPGTMDEAAIYAKALSASQIQNHYATGIGQVASTIASLTSTPGAVFVLINDVLYPTILQDSIDVQRTASDPIPTFGFTLQDDPSNIALQELDDVVFVDTGQIPNPAHNLLVNPAMNPYTTSWTYTSATGVTPATNIGGGLQLTFSNAASGASVKLSQTTQAGMVSAGQQYMASVYIQGTSTPTNVNATLQLNLLNQNGTLVSSVSYSGPTPPSTTPTQYVLSVSVPTGIYYLQMQLVATTTSATNSGNILFTQAQLEPMTFVSGKNYQLSYPTPWAAAGQSNCVVLPNGTTVRQFRLFGGIITKATVTSHIGPNRQWNVTVSGYAWLFSKQLLNDTYTAQTDSSIIASMVAKYFSGVFSTANVASTNGFSNTLSYTYNGTPRDLLDALATNSNYIYGVDAYWTIFYQPPGYNTLSFQLSDSPNDITSFEYYDYSRDTDATQLGNTIYVTGATGIAAIVIDAQSVATYANRLGNISGTFWRQINNSALTSTTAAIDAGIGEAGQYAYARPIVHLSTQQFMIPGYTVYLTSRTDGYIRASFLIQKVTLRLKGFLSVGLATYECTCDLGAFNPELTNILAAILRLQTSTTTGGTTPASYYGPPPAVTPSIDVMATETVNFYDTVTVTVTSTATVPGITTAQYGTAQATYGSNLVGYQ